MIPKGASSSKRLFKVVLFGVIAIVWIVLDQITKTYFNLHEVGDILGGPYLGLFEFKLAHNTGGAWSAFSGSTSILAILSILVCLGVLVFLIYCLKDLSILSIASLALIFAGGIGNAIDRFTCGYVIDFISPVIIDFPIFNIADIGITCGIVLFVISLIFNSSRNSDLNSNHKEQGK